MDMDWTIIGNTGSDIIAKKTVVWYNHTLVWSINKIVKELMVF